MRSLFYAILAALMVVVGPACAQSSATPSQMGYLTNSGCPAGVTYCFVQYGATIPISGSITATNPSVGTNNATAPTSSTQIGILDAGGKLQPASVANPIPVTGSFTSGVAQGSTTSGQLGNLSMGAVTTSSPSYTTAQTSPLSLDTSGNLRVNVVAGGAGGGAITAASGAYASGSIASGAYASGSISDGADVALGNTTTTTACATGTTSGCTTNTLLRALVVQAQSTASVATKIDQTTPGTTNGVQVNAGTAQIGVMVPATHAQTSALASSVSVAAPHTINSFEVTADSTLSASAWYVVVFDATSLPANGSITPAKCYGIPSGQTTFGASFGEGGLALTTGLTVGVSTTGCFTQTASAHAFIGIDYK